jgi:hypothetical protein
VINLAEDKTKVFREMYRVLKPGGRVAVSDIALKKQLPEDLARDIMAYVGCIAGAVKIDDYRAALQAAGFDAVQVIDSGADLDAYASVEGQSGCYSPPMEAIEVPVLSSCCSPETECCSAKSATVHEELSDLIGRYDVNDFAASVKVFAVKPSRSELAHGQR